MQVNDEKLLCVIAHLLPHIVTNVEFDATEEESKPVPLIVKLNPPAVPPCELDKLARVRSYVNVKLVFE